MSVTTILFHNTFCIQPVYNKQEDRRHEQPKPIPIALAYKRYKKIYQELGIVLNDDEW